jgi:hypothetical protein
MTTSSFIACRHLVGFASLKEEAFSCFGTSAKNGDEQCKLHARHHFSLCVLVLFSILLLSQPHFWKSVRMTFTLPKWGLGSPPRLPKLQSSIIGVKTPCLEAFFMSLESY